jgi:hypothetical protein
MPMYNPTMKTDISFCFQIGVSEDFSPLGCDVASPGKSFLTFNMEHEALTITATCSLQNIR